MIYLDSSGLDNKEVKTFKRKFGSNSDKTRVGPQALYEGRTQNTSAIMALLMILMLDDNMVLSILVFFYAIHFIFNWVAFKYFVNKWARSFRCAYSTYPAIRSGDRLYLRGSELVVGDTVILRAGDTIPADGALLDGSLEVDQFYPTGLKEVHDKLPGYADLSDHTCPHVLLRGSVIRNGIGYMEVMDVSTTNKGDLMYYDSSIKRNVPPIMRKVESNLYMHPIVLASAILWLFMTAIVCTNDGLFAASWLGGTYYALIYALLLYSAAKYDVSSVTTLYAHLSNSTDHGVTFTSAGALYRLADVSTVVMDRELAQPIGDYRLGHIFFASMAGLESVKNPMDIPYGLRLMIDFATKETSQVLGDNSGYMGSTEYELLIDGALSQTGSRISDEAVEVLMDYPYTSKRRFTAVSLEHPDHGQITIFRGSPADILPKCSLALVDDGVDAIDMDVSLVDMLSVEAMKSNVVVFAMSDIELDPDGTTMLPDNMQFIGAISVSGLRYYDKYEAYLSEKLGIASVILPPEDIPGAVSSRSNAGESVALVTNDPNLLDDIGAHVTIGVKNTLSGSRKRDVLLPPEARGLHVGLYNAIIDAKKWRLASASSAVAKCSFVVLALASLSFSTIWSIIQYQASGVHYSIDVFSSFLPLILAFYVVYTLLVPILHSKIDYVTADDPSDEIIKPSDMVAGMLFLSTLPILHYFGITDCDVYLYAGALSMPLVWMHALPLFIRVMAVCVPLFGVLFRIHW